MPKTVAVSFPERLQAAAAAVRDTRDAHELALAQRDELIIEGIDVQGMSQQAVAQLVGVAKGRVSAILAGSQPDAGEE